MKKLLIGCLIFTVLLIGLVIGGGVFLYSKGKSFAKSYETAIAQVQEINSDFPYNEPPAGTAMEPDRFQDYLSIRRRINERLMQVSLLAEVASAAEEQRQVDISAMQILGLVAEVPKLVNETATAFRSEEMSIREFRHYSVESLRAIRTGAESGDPQMAELWETMRGMARFVDQQMNQGGNSSNVDVSGSFDTLSSSDVAPQSVALVRGQIDEFKQTPSRYILELIFLQLLEGLNKGGQ
jgi:uncharacterized membrane protein